MEQPEDREFISISYFRFSRVRERWIISETVNGPVIWTNNSVRIINKLYIIPFLKNKWLKVIIPNFLQF